MAEREPWDDPLPTQAELTEWAREYRTKAARAFDLYSDAYWHYEHATTMAEHCAVAAKALRDAGE